MKHIFDKAYILPEEVRLLKKELQDVIVSHAFLGIGGL